ncbi:MAG: amidohydrolase family protein, partial [Gemmatimonadota bacterium]
MRLSSLLLVAGLCTATLLPAQSAPVTALRADRVIIGDGTQIPNAVVLVQGERITAVGLAAQIRIPVGARTIDL